MNTPKNKYEYCTLNWIWSEGNIRLTFPNADERLQKGSYKEIVQTLNELGENGWEVVGCVGVVNWVYWTLRRFI